MYTIELKAREEGWSGDEEDEFTVSDGVIRLDWSSGDGWSDSDEDEPIPPLEGTWQEYAMWQIIPWSYGAGQVVMVMPGISVLNWYLFTGGGKRGFIHGQDSPEGPPE